MTMASLMTTLGITSRVIRSAISTGTPLVSSVESVRANWPNRFSRITLPSTGMRNFMLSIFRRPLSVALYRMNRMLLAITTTNNTIQKTGFTASSPTLISNCVDLGRVALKLSKISVNFGSMNVMKNRTITKPTKPTMAG